MGNLISDLEKAVYSAARIDIFDTFARDITIYTFPNQTAIATTEDYNHFYQNDNQYVSYQPVSGVFKANVLYNPKQELQKNNQGPGSQQINVSEFLGDVRVKVKQDAYQYLMDKQEIEFDGTKFMLSSAPRPHGLFDVQLYTFFLTRKV
jgi:hypothetical protein